MTDDICRAARPILLTIACSERDNGREGALSDFPMRRRAADGAARAHASPLFRGPGLWAIDVMRLALITRVKRKIPKSFVTRKRVIRLLNNYSSIFPLRSRPEEGAAAAGRTAARHAGTRLQGPRRARGSEWGLRSCDLEIHANAQAFLLFSLCARVFDAGSLQSSGGEISAPGTGAPLYCGPCDIVKYGIANLRNFVMSGHKFGATSAGRDGSCAGRRGR
ncbi:hypothetical protein EVAR_35620_1 [Eumeta japonica]|uniref:Uncharacterized protein n=1 Tax=Eumeta variegata TaxID=151549 RepID=A0A4C1WF08_EUMVA|nr:hypothetical protein EVAR_35620_1 [Eumeta japonica]